MSGCMCPGLLGHLDGCPKNATLWCCPGVGTMAHVRGCVNHPESAPAKFPGDPVTVTRVELGVADAGDLDVEELAELTALVAEVDAAPDAGKVETLRVMVTVDTDELREWAGRHAGAGRHGVAHVLYKAAEDGESLGEQALREARREAGEQIAQAIEAKRDEHWQEHLAAHPYADATSCPGDYATHDAYHSAARIAREVSR